jgi:hypothetical protein
LTLLDTATVDQVDGEIMIENYDSVEVFVGVGCCGDLGQ